MILDTFKQLEYTGRMVTDFDALIEALGGRQAVEDLLGVTAAAISNYRSAGDFPAWTADVIGARANELGIEIAPQLFRPLQRPAGRRKQTIAAE